MVGKKKKKKNVMARILYASLYRKLQISQTSHKIKEIVQIRRTEIICSPETV